MNEAQSVGAGNGPSVDPDRLAFARRAVAGKLTIAAFGEVISVLMRSPQYRHYTLADLEWLVAPAILNRQFSLVQMRKETQSPSAPIAVVMWASVSPEIEQSILANLGAPIRLTAKERKSGDRNWITDAAGDQRTLPLVLRNLRKTAFAGAPVKTVARSASGELRVVQL